MKSKIILKRDIPNLGVAGDVRLVAPGYARNYLLPQGLAVFATARHAAHWEQKRQQLNEENKGKLTQAQEMAKKLEALDLQIQSRAGEDGKLFGAVTTADVARHLAGQGFPIDRRWIQFREAVRTVGEFSAHVRLHPQVHANVKVRVVAQG